MACIWTWKETRDQIPLGPFADHVCKLTASCPSPLGSPRRPVVRASRMLVLPCSPSAWNAFSIAARSTAEGLRRKRKCVRGQIGGPERILQHDAEAWSGGDETHRGMVILIVRESYLFGLIPGRLAVWIAFSTCLVCCRQKSMERDGDCRERGNGKRSATCQPLLGQGINRSVAGPSTYCFIEHVDGEHVCLCGDGGDGDERHLRPRVVGRLWQDDLDVVESSWTWFQKSMTGQLLSYNQT